MKDLIKIAVVLAVAFASTFFIARATGFLEESQVRAALESAYTIEPVWFVLLVIGALWIDLLIAVPTMATILLAGHFLGPVLGTFASVTGLLVMGLTGYAIGHRFGRPGLMRLYGKGSAERLAGIEASFARNDLLVLFACQALPILPELACCLAGISRMPLRRFLLGYSIGVVPFAAVVAWAGSISTVADPSPGVIIGIGVTVALLLIWTLLRRRQEAPDADARRHRKQERV
jgi:uncharacterized membrane protein YdjX (TVP38/TMEM64 family)